MYVYIYICMYVYIYIYIERERERDIYMCPHMEARSGGNRVALLV